MDLFEVIDGLDEILSSAKDEDDKKILSRAIELLEGMEEEDE